MLVVNPGTEPCEGATEANAVANIERFVADCLMENMWWRREPEADRDGGRFGFIVGQGGKGQKRWVEVWMPGLPLERVRYTGEGDQDCWDFPRLYVEGSSWLWTYALTITRGKLEGEAREKPCVGCGRRPGLGTGCEGELMSGIHIKEGESFERALRRFKKWCEKAQILSDLRKHSHFEKPDERKKRKRAAARRKLRELKLKE